MPSDRARPLAGLFVGGESTRMGSPKGLIEIAGVTLIERWLAVFRGLSIEARLVGKRAEYIHFDATPIEDDPREIGPAGGLRALLLASGVRPVIAVACDMPRVSPPLIARLLSAAPGAPAVAARVDGFWLPFFARYDAGRALPLLDLRLARREHSLVGLLDELGAVELPLDDGERRELVDWDTPADVR